MNIMADRKNIAGTAEQVAQVFQEYQDVGTDLLVLDLSMRPAEIVQTLEWIATCVWSLTDTSHSKERHVASTSLVA